MAIDYSKCTTAELSGLLWDYYKEVHNFRPRHLNFNDREAMLESLQSLDNHMAHMTSTYEGRKMLRAEGWVIDVTEEDRLEDERFAAEAAAEQAEAAALKAMAPTALDYMEENLRRGRPKVHAHQITDLPKTGRMHVKIPSRFVGIKRNWIDVEL